MHVDCSTPGSVASACVLSLSVAVLSVCAHHWGCRRRSGRTVAVRLGLQGKRKQVQGFAGFMQLQKGLTGTRTLSHRGGDDGWVRVGLLLLLGRHGRGLGQHRQVCDVLGCGRRKGGTGEVIAAGSQLRRFGQLQEGPSNPNPLLTYP